MAKLQIHTILTDANKYNIPLDSKDILLSLTHTNVWTLRLFNTSEDSASTPALFNSNNTKPLANHIDYARTQSNNPLLFIKKHLVGTTTSKAYTNVRYHYVDTTCKKTSNRNSNRKTELVLTSQEARELLGSLDTEDTII